MIIKIFYPGTNIIKNYYDFLKKEDLEHRTYEAPYIRYFLNDFVCCLENICIGHWENIGYKEKRAYIKKLRQEKLVRYMIRKKDVVPTYSRLIIKMFERHQFFCMEMVIRIKFFVKKYLYGIFLILKEKVN